MTCKFFYFVFFKKFDFDPDPKLPKKADPDPQQILSDPTYRTAFQKLINLIKS